MLNHDKLLKSGFKLSVTARDKTLIFTVIEE
jgi:hypothetical protein